MCYAKRYYAQLTGIPATNSLLLQLPPQTRLNVMKSLTALSKYLGCYEQWKNTIKQYNLKWTTGNESIASLERFFNPNLTLDSMLQRIKEMIRVLPATMAAVIRFTVLTGLRPAEACESVRLLRSGIPDPKYYNPSQQCLEHFRFPDIFLRATKKAYISYLSLSNYQWIRTFGPRTPTPTWNAIRLACRRRRINMDMHLCRRIFASWLRQSGIQPEVVDMLQGRVSQSVLTRHYLVPQSSLKDQVLDALDKLRREIEL